MTDHRRAVLCNLGRGLAAFGSGLCLGEAIKYLLPLLLISLSGCDSCLPESWKVPAKVGFERMAAARLTSCVQNNLCQYRSQCFAESEAYCVDAGYSPRCGFAEPEGTCGVNVGGSAR